MWAKHWLAGAAFTAAAVGGAAEARALETPLAAPSAPAAAVASQAAGSYAVTEAPWLEAAEVDGFGTAAVDAADLAEMSGGQSIVVAISNHDLDAINRDNTITAETVGSGSVELGANAFSGFNGIGNFVINTGHNNNLQGSLSVNVVLSQ